MFDLVRLTPLVHLTVHPQCRSCSAEEWSLILHRLPVIEQDRRLEHEHGVFQWEDM